MIIMCIHSSIYLEVLLNECSTSRKNRLFFYMQSLTKVANELLS